jgi:hypothetical protein
MTDLWFRLKDLPNARIARIVLSRSHALNARIVPSRSRALRALRAEYVLFALNRSLVLFAPSLENLLSRNQHSQGLPLLKSLNRRLLLKNL